ncbi:FHA domain-containing protein [Streptomyces sp. NPDC056600]|uniref:FHA domain-containing protein n=1 Tax=Streptomyces sp. NPDC056600 TaxID=3345874 RepID=UPI0036999714
MQIRLTVVDPLNPTAASRDVLVTAPAGTTLAAVAADLATAVPGGDGGGTALYAGAERLDPLRRVLGEPPLVDGAVLSLGAPADPDGHLGAQDGTGPAAVAELHVVAGPDAGGVHLLHGGQVTVGRSVDAEIPLDDPDVSRTHCAVTVAPDGSVTVADLRSTNGTRLDGRVLDSGPVPLAPGALLRVGESTLRLALPASVPPSPVTADGEGCLRLSVGPGGPGSGGPDPTVGSGAPGAHGAPAAARADRTAAAQEAQDAHAQDAQGSRGAWERQGGWVRQEDRYRQEGWDARETRGGGTARGATGEGPAGEAAGVPGGPDAFPGTPSGHSGRLAASAATGGRGDAPAADGPTGVAYGSAYGGAPGAPTAPGEAAAPGEAGEPARRRGITAWARRLTAGRSGGERADAASSGRTAHTDGWATVPRRPDTWPDPAELLLTALGPGPRLWERGHDHPEALTVRLGTADRPSPDGEGLLPAVPVTAALREAGSLGLAGPRPRLAGLARAVLAQLAALHSPDILEIVLISADRSRPLEERTAEWAWLGLLPHVRPTQGQDCRLLLAHDRDQAAARTEELLRRVADSAAAPSPAPNGPGGPAAPRTGGLRSTVLVVDGDPGGADVRDAVSRLTLNGPRAGVHVLCLAETAPASPASPLTETYETACSLVPAFRACGAVALLSGDVATALRLLRLAPVSGVPAPRSGSGSATPAGPVLPRTAPVGHGTVGAVDAVSPAWAERFARALAPLRADAPPSPSPGAAGSRGPQPGPSQPLPDAARLLDELGLARATPSSLLARWADAADDPDSPGGRAVAVLGAGPHGPVAVDLAAEGPHLLAEGAVGSGRTELLRAVVASLASAERPERLAVLLVDGSASPRAQGLEPCAEIPHVTGRLVANDPLIMREFAQSLTAELKRRGEVLGLMDFASWHAGRMPARVVPQRGSAAAGPADPVTMPRLVVVVDDLDALLHPALGAPGRPSAGSVVRALEAVTRDGGRLGVHLVAAAVSAEGSEPGRLSSLRVLLDDGAPTGRGRLLAPGGSVTPFQGGRVTGRIPRTGTLRPTVQPLDWSRMGDPPTRRPVRELGNGPTDLALLTSALTRAAAQHPTSTVPSAAAR